MSMPVPIIRLDRLADRVRMLDMLRAIGVERSWYLVDVGTDTYSYIAVSDRIHLFMDDEAPCASKYLGDRPVTIMNSPRQMIDYVKRMRCAYGL